MTKKQKLQGPPKTRFRRAKVVGGMALRAASTKIKSEVQAMFMADHEVIQHREHTREQIAQLIFSGLSQLRGTALKLAQIFCSDTGLLPEIYLRTLEQSHHKVPPLSPALARGLLRRELGVSIESVFSEFGEHAHAAASLGQVHRARLLSGELVAVKIQYPGMQESLLADMGLARMALKPVTQTKLMLTTLSRIEERLKEEIDYRNEAANLEWFGRQNFPIAVAIPKVYPQCSSKRVLTMQWMEGLTIDAWLDQNPSQERRNRLAQNMFDLFLYCLFQLGRFHADANLGNFLISEEDQLVLLDFGAVLALPAQEIEFYRLLWSGSAETELPELRQMYQDHGAQVDEHFWETSIRPYLQWKDQFKKADTFDFAKHPDFLQEGYHIFTNQLLNPAMQNYADQLTMVHRTLLGLFALFARMRAQIAVA